MRRPNLLRLLDSLSTEDLKHMITAKTKLADLEQQKVALDNKLASISKKIASLQSILASKRGAGRLRGRISLRARRKRIVQPSVSSLVVEILKEKKKPLKVNEISNAFLNEKGYKTQAKNFKGQLRILLYKNDKGLFKKVGPGVFALAGEKEKAKQKKSAKE